MNRRVPGSGMTESRDEAMEIRLLKVSDAEMLSRYHGDNEAHFRRWEPEREHDYYSVEKLRDRLAVYEVEQKRGLAAYFVALENDEIIAHCSLTNIIYGPFRACVMGYGVAKKFEGRGVMTEVCRQAIDYAFRDLELNRIMANYMPRNHRSARLLEKLGFVREGLARKYLRINGVWEDHVLTSLLNPANCDR